MCQRQYVFRRLPAAGGIALGALPSKVLDNSWHMRQHRVVTGITEFLYPAPARRSLGGIVRWWESRRLHYNLIVGGSGLVSLAVVRVISWLPPDPHGGLPPLMVVLVFGTLANLCYLLGPVVEVAVDQIWGRSVLPVGPALFRMGLTFSVGLTLLPVLIFLIDWAFRIVRAII